MTPQLEHARLDEGRTRRVLWDAQMRTAVAGMLAVGLVMLAFEAVKSALWHDMTLWESHTLTIVFSAVAGGLAVWGAIRRHAKLQGALLHESFERRRLSELSARLTAHTVELEASNTQLAAEVELRTRLERQLVQSQKMESIARIAGGLAHDFNNVLSVIFSSLEMAQLAVQTGEPFDAELRAALDAAERAARLSRQLLSFARHRPMELVPVDLNALIDQSEPMLRRLAGEAVQVSVRLEARAAVVRGVLSQLEQVLFNLVVNAADAMPGGGHIEICTRSVSMVAASLPASGVGGSILELSVSDTGTGIPDDVLPHLFEPFFSTKGEGKGTGLGLATSYAIVSRCGGVIEAANSPAGGAVFRVLLPIGHELAHATAHAASAGGAGRGERILLVEDQSHVREAARRLLEGAGFHVTAAEDGKAALAVARQMPHAPHLVVTDVIMPRLGGRAMVDTLRERWPDVPVLFMSGFTDEVVMREGESRTVFMEKPFSRDALLSRVTQLLATAQRDA
jgi:C4-dicarboxylate-specific signal transduction histidine kinase